MAGVGNQGNRFTPKEQQVRLAKRPNGALHTSPGQRPGNIAQYNARRSEGTPHILAAYSCRIFLPHIPE